MPSPYLGFKAHLEKQEALVQRVCFFSEYFEVGGSWGDCNVHVCEPSRQTVLSVTVRRTHSCPENLAIKPFTGWIPTERVFSFFDVYRGFPSSRP